MSHYDARLLLLATMVSFCGSVIAFRLFSRLRGSRGSVRFVWTMLTGLVAGSGAWATHFLTLLADAGLQGGFMPSLTMASLMVAILFMSAGFAVASVDKAGANQIAGGVTIGLGLAAMHYMGMWAVAIDGRLVWEHALVGASVGLGVLISVGAILLVGHCRKASEQVIGGLLLMLATGAVHFL
ncbi:MAG TPA: MHYT domain-containing protein, partial [Caulobacteraceae bacterium]